MEKRVWIPGAAYSFQPVEILKADCASFRGQTAFSMC